MGGKERIDVTHSIPIQGSGKEEVDDLYKIEG